MEERIMKNIFTALLGIVLMLLPNIAFAGKFPGVPKVWTVPAVYQFDEEVTFFFDVTDIGFQEGVDLYLWAWEPTEPDAGNRDNSSDFAKLEYTGNGIYKKTMTPTQYFNCGLEKFDGFAGLWMQLKVKNDGDCTTEFSAPDSRQVFKDFAESGKDILFYPDKFLLKEPLSILVNANELEIGGKKGGLHDLNFTSLNLHSGLNNWEVMQGIKVWLPNVMEKTAFKDLGNGLYKFDMTPFEYYNSTIADDGSIEAPAVPDDYELENMTYIIVPIVNGDWGPGSGDRLQKAGNAPIYPDPAFSYFPQKICALDIVTLTRQWNEKNAGTLKYTITAGSRTITGDMEGNRDKREASVNLLKELEGLTNLSKISLKIETANGITVVNTDIPLISLSEIE